MRVIIYRMAHPSDLTDRFLLENLDIRGQVVRLGPLWRAILSRREYPESFRQLLGEEGKMPSTLIKERGIVVE